VLALLGLGIDASTLDYWRDTPWEKDPNFKICLLSGGFVDLGNSKVYLT